MKVMIQMIVFSMVIKYTRQYKYMKIKNECNGTPQFNLGNRSQYGNGCDFKHEIIAYRSNNCFTPTKGFCFVKYIKNLTGEYDKQQHLHFFKKWKKTINFYD